MILDFSISPIPHNIGIEGKNASEEDGNIFYVMDNNNELYY